MKNWIALLLVPPALALSACGGNNGSEDGQGPLRCDPGFAPVNGECVSSDTGRPTTDTGSGVTDSGLPPDTSGTDTSTGTDTGVEEDVGPCEEGATRCGPDDQPQICGGGDWRDDEPCLAGEICEAGRCVPGIDCTPGFVAGCASDTERNVCNDEGSRFEAVACPDGQFCLRGECGDELCVAGERDCEGDFTIIECNADGTAWQEVEVCDRRGGRVCDNGECVSGCVAAAKNPTYIGCEYWSVDLPQYEDPTTAGPEIPHSVVLSNVGEFPAEITVETRAAVTPPAPITVPPGEARTIEFPRLDVTGTELTNNSFRISTTEPVVAYQFNPLNNVNLFSNDASLLLPTNGIGNDYYVLGWPGGASIGLPGLPSFEAQRSFFTVVATAPATTRVTITFASDAVDGTTITGITEGSTQMFEMEQFGVLNFAGESDIATFSTQDFTGTRISADRPIVVFAGHEQAVIGEDGDEGSNCCADHLEQQLFPIESWGTRYFAVHSPPRGSEPDVWKIIAAEDRTLITTNPPIPELDGTLLNAGEYVEASVTESFEIQATGPVLVGQFLVSQQSAGVSRTVGDPAFVLATPVAGFRDNYVVLTPENYSSDYITIIRPFGVSVSLDGATVSGFATFGSGTHEFVHVEVSPGVHRIDADEPVAVAAYGYDSAVSYGYPGGLNLGDLPEPDPIP